MARIGSVVAAAGLGFPASLFAAQSRQTAAGSVSGPESLKAHAERRGLLYGCAVNARMLRDDPAYAQLIREQCNIVVAENAMKWTALHPAPETYTFNDADALVDFAEKSGIKVRGHNLCWHRQIPAWVAQQATTANAASLLTGYVHKVAGRYAGRMHSWDVVNEAIDIRSGREDGLRESVWLKLAGPGYLEQAYRAAREADPHALLTYNDYGIEGEDEGSAKKRAAVLTLVRGLKTSGLVDALGVQSHIEAGKSYGSGLTHLLGEARDMGLQIFITEMDVNDRSLPADVSQRDAGVAASYGSFLDLVLREPAVRAVLTWGITDRGTWLNSEDTRADKLPERCLPFDSSLVAKPAFFAIRKSFDNRKNGAS